MFAIRPRYWFSSKPWFETASKADSFDDVYVLVSDRASDRDTSFLARRGLGEVAIVRFDVLT